jgi:HlyD family secretion protein
MQWRRRIGLFLLIGAIVLTIGYGFWPQPIPVDVKSAIRAPLQVTIEEEGKSRVIDRFVLSAPVTGFARRVELDVGDAISRGQVLMVLEPLPSDLLDPRSRAQAEARVAAARAALNAAQENARAAVADADVAALDFQRIEYLYKKDSASKQERDNAGALALRTRANQRSAEFSVEVARFELKAALTALQYSAAQNRNGLPEKVMIRAPVTGSIFKIHHQSEGVVTAGEALIEIGTPRTLEVEVDVLSADAVRINPGMRVLFDRWGGDKILEGLVRVVEPAGFTKISALGVEEQRVLVIVDITSPPEIWKRLGDGYRLEARFILWEGHDILQIPSSALFRYKKGWAVFMVKKKKARRRLVQVGKSNGLSTQIIDGLAEGDTVITHPDDAIKDGSSIRLRDK